MKSAPADLPAGWWECHHTDPAYPQLLRAIAAPPPLAVRGRLEPAAPMVAIVGARRCTTYGEELAYEIAFELAGMGVTIVSGLARGIDAAAHRGALDGGGATVAVMGTGPDTVYPPEHQGLAERVSAAGALVTQFPVGTPPVPYNFPIRNQTISGLCIGVLVVEARRKSGAMLTAGAAADQGRVVMATPGSVRNPASRGCHDLLRDGGRLVTNAREVMTETSAEPLFRMLLPPAPVSGRRPFGDRREEVVVALETGSLTLDDLVGRLSGPAADVVTAVARLRLDGDIRLRDGLYGLAAAGPAGIGAVRT